MRTSPLAQVAPAWVEPARNEKFFSFLQSQGQGHGCFEGHAGLARGLV
jgi:hypothetical protein